MSSIGHPVPGEWLSAYYDGELDAARREQFEAHLTGCAECRRALAELKSLSDALSADAVRDEGLAGHAAFWRNLKPRLPDRRATRSTPDGLSVWLRWLPGLGLLLLTGVVQVAGVVATVVFLALSQTAVAPSWTLSINRLAASAVMGWLVWLLPAQWTGWGLFALFTLTSVALAVLYLAWLGYEWRYGRWALEHSAST